MDPITLCNFAANPWWTIVNTHLTVVFDITNSAKVFLIFLYFFLFFVSVFIFFSWCCHSQFLARWSFIKKITATALNHSAVKWSFPVFFYQFSRCSKHLRLCKTVTINRVFKKNSQGIISRHYFQISLIWWFHFFFCILLGSCLYILLQI